MFNLKGRSMMKKSQVAARKSCFVIFVCVTVALFIQQTDSAYARTPQTKEADKPYTVEYYYKVKWGFADEFIRLFKKNHFPVLKKQIETGRMLKVTAVKPRYHNTEDGRWDYRVTI